jgi:hypothetical protein
MCARLCDSTCPDTALSGQYWLSKVRSNIWLQTYDNTTAFSPPAWGVVFYRPVWMYIRLLSTTYTIGSMLFSIHIDALVGESILSQVEHSFWPWVYLWLTNILLLLLSFTFLRRLFHFTRILIAAPTSGEGAYHTLRPSCPPLCLKWSPCSSTRCRKDTEFRLLPSVIRRPSRYRTSSLELGWRHWGLSLVTDGCNCPGKSWLLWFKCCWRVKYYVLHRKPITLQLRQMTVSDSACNSFWLVIPLLIA